MVRAGAWIGKGGIYSEERQVPRKRGRVIKSLKKENTALVKRASPEETEMQQGVQCKR